LLPFSVSTFLFIVSYFTSKLRLFDVFWVAAIDVAAVSDAREDRLSLENRLGEGFGVKIPLPRKALGIAVFDDKRLAHSTVGAPNSRLRLVELDAPNMSAAITNRLILFHRISVSAQLEWLHCGSKGRRSAGAYRERRLDAGRRPFPVENLLPGRAALRSCGVP
jgi:hypothetical protein